MVKQSIGDSAAKKLDEKQLVVFKVGDEEFGVDINEVREINRWEEVTRIPNSAPYIKGVINLRGNIIVVTDLAMKLGMHSKEIDDDTRILVVELGNNETVGMVVDSATEVLRLSGEKIRDAPQMITSNIDSNYIEGVGLLENKRLLTLLDLAKVLESEDYEKILKAQQTAQSNVAKKEQNKPEKPVKKEETKEETPAKTKEDKKTDDKKSEKKEEKTDSKETKKETPKKKEDKPEKSEENSKTSDKDDKSDSSKKTDSSKEDSKTDKEK